MTPKTHKSLKDRLLQRQPLSADEQRQVHDSAELREFCATLDLIADRSAEAEARGPNPMLDARILAHGREAAARRQSAPPLLARLNIWHYVTGALAACLLVVTTISVLQRQSPYASPEQVAENTSDRNRQPTLLAPGSRTETLQLPTARALEPKLSISQADVVSWDAMGLEREIFSLQSTITIDLDRGATAAGVADML